MSPFDEWKRELIDTYGACGWCGCPRDTYRVMDGPDGLFIGMSCTNVRCQTFMHDFPQAASEVEP